MNRNIEKNRNFWLIISGFLGLAIVMGIGRFVYTPIFPYMEIGTINPFLAGLLATFNYIGYFIGALGARYIPHSLTWFYIGIVTNIATTIFMGFTEVFSFWAVYRLLSGITSGMIFVFISSLILTKLNRYGKIYYSGFLYGGVGFGILVSGLLIPTFQNFSGWQGTWISLGILSLLWLAIVIIGLNKSDIGNEDDSLKSNSRNNYGISNKQKISLYFSYTCEGFGYIIFGTFIIAMLESNRNFVFTPSYVWAIVGLGAIPSCLFWAWLGNKKSYLFSLKCAYITQIISILIPVFTDNGVWVMISAFGFGATFMGITTLTMTIANLLKTDESNLVSGLTASYGLGQILGPLVAGTVISASDYKMPFMISAVVLLAAFISIYVFKYNRGEDSVAIRKY